jgi:formylglycine-generating enzyme required for sulfatase activity
MRRFIPLFALLALVACSNQGTRPKDEVIPGRVTDLKVVDIGDSTVTLAWTAPGDDGAAGKAEAYEVRWLNRPIVEVYDWTEGTVVGPLPVPGVVGTRETAVLLGIPGGDWRYFGLKSRDEAGNWSIISNNDKRAWLGAPAYRAVPDTLDFGDVPVGQSFEREFVLHNDGGGTLRGSVSADCSSFALVSGGATVALRHGENQTVVVRFTPRAEGDASCRIEVGGPFRPVGCVGRGVLLLPISMIAIETGPVFSMGSPVTEVGRDPADERSHPVRLTRSFLAGAHEVTQAEWFAIMGWNDSAFPGGDRPVERITWFDALEFCNRMSARDSLTAVYDIGGRSTEGSRIVHAEVVTHWANNGYRLPTEAEWEFAARGGLSGSVYAWGNELNPGGKFMANTWQGRFPVKDEGKDGFPGLAPVAQFPPNGYGLHDESGNAWEWVSDWYRPDAYARLKLAGGVAKNPAGPASPYDPAEPTEKKRVHRGGSFLCTDQYCTRYMVGTRGKGEANTASNHVGFRCVKAP